MTRFAGLTEDMFKIYTPDKWSSHVHNLPRMRNKDAMLALCDAAAAGLETELDGLGRASSDEIPTIVNQKRVEAQWVYWFRDATARKSLATFLEKTPLDQANIFNIAPQDKHVNLAVVMRNTELWIGLRLASGAVVDRRNLASKLSNSWDREHFLSLLKELPDGATLGFENEVVSAADVTLEHLTKYAEELSASDQAWLVGSRIDVNEAVQLSAELVDDVRRWLGALAPLYRFTAWTQDNDLIEANKQIQQEKAEKRRQATGFNPGDRVRITSGLFSGKLGTVQETDTKAQVKVLVGKMSVVVPGDNLVPAR